MLTHQLFFYSYCFTSISDSVGSVEGFTFAPALVICSLLLITIMCVWRKPNSCPCKKYSLRRQNIHNTKRIRQDFTPKNCSDNSYVNLISHPEGHSHVSKSTSSQENTKLSKNATLSPDLTVIFNN